MLSMDDEAQQGKELGGCEVAISGVGCKLGEEWGVPAGRGRGSGALLVNI